MKKITRIEPKITSWFTKDIDDLGRITDIAHDFEIVHDEVQINVIGCRIDKVEPRQDYTVWAFLKAGKPGWKGNYQDRWSPDYFLTCSCGAPGCAGYWDGIRIHRKKDTVRVSGSIQNGYKKGVVGTGDSVVYFDKTEFDELRKHYMDQFKANPLGIFQDGDFFFTGRWAMMTWR